MNTNRRSLHNQEETENYVRLDDIIIPEDFIKAPTGRLKIVHAEEYYMRFGCFDKPISVIAGVNERGKPNQLILIDEYSRYQAARNLNLEFVEVKYIDINNIEL
jgi:hypothetical protein